MTFDLDNVVRVKGREDVVNLLNSNRTLRNCAIAYVSGIGNDLSKILSGPKKQIIETLCKNYPEETKRLYQWHIALQDVSSNYLKDRAADKPKLLEKVATMRGKDKLIVTFLIEKSENLLKDGYQYGKLESFEKDMGKTIQTTMKDWLDDKFQSNSGVIKLVQGMLDEKYSKKHKKFVVDDVKRDDDGVVQISFSHITGDRYVRQLPDDGGPHWDRPVKTDVVSIDTKNKKIVTTYKSSKTFMTDVIDAIRKSDAKIDLVDEQYSFEMTDEDITLPDVNKEVIENLKTALQTKTLCAIDYLNLNAEGNPSKVSIEGDDVQKFLNHLEKNNIKFDQWVDENNVTRTYRLNDGRKYKISKSGICPLSRKFTLEEKKALKALFEG